MPQQQEVKEIDPRSIGKTDAIFIREWQLKQYLAEYPLATPKEIMLATNTAIQQGILQVTGK